MIVSVLSLLLSVVVFDAVVVVVVVAVRSWSELLKDDIGLERVSIVG
jgi:hypothetical protein